MTSTKIVILVIVIFLAASYFFYANIKSTKNKLAPQNEQQQDSSIDEIISKLK